MGKKKNETGLGKSLIRQRFGKHNKTDKDSYLHTADLQDGYEWGRLNLQSVTEQNNLEDFLATAELAGTEFTAEKLNVKFISKASTGLPQGEELAHIKNLHKQHEKLLRIPRRPPWTTEMAASELEQNERQAFLEWRRTLAMLQDVEGLVMTPYEKNLDFWRQLWRVTERSDVVVQIVDARNPLLFYCNDLEVYVRELGEEKMCVMLINKADYLDDYQRDQWAKYFQQKGIRIVFWSAVNETNRQEAEEKAAKAANEQFYRATDSDITDIADTDSESDDVDDEESMNDDVDEAGNLDNEMKQDTVNDEGGKTIEIDEENKASSKDIKAKVENSNELEMNKDSNKDIKANNEIEMSDESKTEAEAVDKDVGSGCSDCDKPDVSGDKNVDISTDDCGACGTMGGLDTGGVDTQSETIVNTGHIHTGPELVEYLRNIHTGKKVNEERTTIGMVGYPNVGKSSTINAILKMKKVPVSATPGRTKHFQTLYVDTNLMMCDCPGLVFPSFVTTKADLVINGILPIDQMRDCIPPTSLSPGVCIFRVTRTPDKVCNRIPRSVIQKTYGVLLPQPEEGEDPDRLPTAHELLSAYGAMRGYMTARGQPDGPRSARYILKDYVNGKLLYCDPPPGIDIDEFNNFDHNADSSLATGVSMATSSAQDGASTSSRVDQEFFKKEQSTVHQRTARKGGKEESQSEGQNEKPWKKHNNRHKKEKMRRVYGYLDK